MYNKLICYCILEICVLFFDKCLGNTETKITLSCRHCRQKKFVFKNVLGMG